MKIYSINSTNHISFNAGKPARQVSNAVSNISEAAKAELEEIEKSGKVAGTAHAWWRDGYHSAVSALRKLADRLEDHRANEENIVKNFHDFSEEGLI